MRVLANNEIRCELVDGTLVEKPGGQIGSVLGGWLIHCLWSDLETRNLGRVFGADAPHELKPG
ncbi:Uma2 family endonuclease [Schlesneria paludicola]|uniref:Uma2 family endonuclease n=1 Tax=Schlesneria paludicola TaxID=360056 RepID=UPI0012F7A041|nr:Uma2 family endonuclease [Schlesneria paludicola]